MSVVRTVFTGIFMSMYFVVGLLSCKPVTENGIALFLVVSVCLYMYETCKKITGVIREEQCAILN